MLSKQSDDDDDDGDNNSPERRHQSDDDGGIALSGANLELPIWTHRLNITNVAINDTGNYTCAKPEPGALVERHFRLQSIIAARIVDHSLPVVRTKISQSVQFYCIFEAHPMTAFVDSLQWTKDDEIVHSAAMPSNRSVVTALNSTHINVTLDTADVSKKDNGSYACSMLSPFTDRRETFTAALLVLDVPQVSIDYVKAVGANRIFLNWTINDGNDPVSQYFVQYLKDDSNTSFYYNHAIDGRNVSYVLENFDANTQYQIKIIAKNSIGSSPTYTYPQRVRTLATDPVFIPKISVKGNSHSTITIGWSPPPAELLEYIHYYELIVTQSGGNASVIEEAVHLQNSRNLPYMFDNLSTATEYRFNVRSCNELTKQCGNWSDEVTGTTMDGQSSEPLNLEVTCTYYNISGRTTVSATWDPPAKPNGNITTYQIVLDGLSTFRSEARGPLKNVTYGPKAKSIAEKLQKADYENVPANTNYTVRVSGVTRSKRPGDAAVATCTMPPTVPETVGRLLWGKVEASPGNWVFKLFLPQITERNGPICGYRIYLVRIGRQHKHLPMPESLEIMSYHEAHAANNSRGGAYIAEVFSADNFRSEIILGDEQRIPTNETGETNEACRKLLNGFYAKPIRSRMQSSSATTSTTTTTAATVANGDGVGEEVTPALPPPLSTQKERLDRAGNLTSEASKILNSKNRRRKRQHLNNSIPTDDKLGTTTTTTTTSLPLLMSTAAGATESPTIITINSNSFEVFDGPLDPASNYTGFVEVIGEF